MKRYDIVTNDYEMSIELKKDLLNRLNAVNWVLDEEKPDYVFVIGGDGTFLKASRKYNNILDSMKFVPFKSGGIGFYTNHNRTENIERIIEVIDKDQECYVEYELLEVKFNEELQYVLNEVKILNETRPVYIDIEINNNYLETFHGTGLVVSTSNGSTGYMKATGGAIILDKSSGLYELQELVPISTNKYRTLNSPIILNSKHTLKLKGEVNKEKLIIDTFIYDLETSDVEIKLSNKKITVISVDEAIGEIELLRDIFVKDKESFE